MRSSSSERTVSMMTGSLILRMRRNVLEAVHARHLHVEQHQVGLVVAPSSAYARPRAYIVFQVQVHL